MGLLAIGGCLMDVVARAGVPFEAGTSCPGEVKRTPGGVARNVATLVASANQSVRFVTAIGDDGDGRVLMDGLARAGIDTTHVLTCPGHSTGTYVAVHDDHGHMVAAIVDMAVFDALGPAAISVPLDSLLPDDRVFADGNLSAETLGYIASRCGERLILDAVSRVKARRLAPVLTCGAVFFMNRDEAGSLLESDFASAALAARALLSRGVSHAVVTDGKSGLAVIENGEIHNYTISPVTMVDETGAGDALIAGTILGLLSNEPLTLAVQRGTTAARHALSVSGALTRLPDLAPEPAISGP